MPQKTRHEPGRRQVVAYTQAVGGVISQLRQLQGTTQAEMAAILGLSQSGYSKLERGKAVMNIVQLRQAAAALGTSSADLLSRAEEVFADARSQGYEVRMAPPRSDGENAAMLLGGAGLLLLVAAALRD